MWCKNAYAPKHTHIVTREQQQQQRQQHQVNRVRDRDLNGVCLLTCSLRSFVGRGWNSLESGSNKWSKNQDLCTFIIKFSQLVRLFFVIFSQMKMQLFCSGKWFTLRPKPFFVYSDMLYEACVCAGARARCYCRLQLFCRCFGICILIVLSSRAFCFALHTCAFLLHTNFVHSSHVIKTNIVYSSPDASALRYSDTSTHTHTPSSSCFFVLSLALSILFHSISTFSTKSNGFNFYSFFRNFACTYRCECMHAHLFLSYYRCIYGVLVAINCQVALKIHTDTKRFSFEHLV